MLPESNPRPTRAVQRQPGRPTSNHHLKLDNTTAQVRLTLPAAELGTSGADGGGTASQSGVPPPAHLRRLLQQQQQPPQQQQQSPQPPPEPPDPPPAPGVFPPFAQVPVVLSFVRGGGAVAVNASGLPADAGTVNTTRCIRYAAGFNVSSGAFDPTPWADALGGQLQPQLTLYRPGERPPLNLSGCAASTTIAATTSQQVIVQASARG